ncbi:MULTISPECIES: DUF2799 domain-containing protein [Psychrobacter]|uniref:DUF2799 domain-containing protein n=1 Tax=Psychrobacter TaxID=497 RepID=UPI000ECC5BE1|nr:MULTISPECIES: DUF2799 domain-containing protein [Psychrobacter]HCT73353.1 hypothetical protein [Psychrobacter sp.]
MKIIIIALLSVLVLTGCEQVYWLKILTQATFEEFTNRLKASKQCKDPNFWFQEGYSVGIKPYDYSIVSQHSTCEYHDAKIADNYEEQWKTGYQKGVIEKICVSENLYQFGIQDTPNYFTDETGRLIEIYSIFEKIENYCPVGQKKGLKVFFYQGKIDKIKKDITRNIEEIERLNKLTPEKRYYEVSIDYVEGYIASSKNEIQILQQEIENLSKP